MRINPIQSAIAIMVTALVLSIATAFAEKPEDKVAALYEATLQRVPKLELPAKAASLVKDAEPQDRQATALGVIRVVAQINPSAVPATVGSITRFDPQLAKATASEATKLHPRLAREINLAADTGVSLAVPAAAPQPVIAVSAAPAAVSVTKAAAPVQPTAIQTVSVQPLGAAPQPLPGPPYRKGHYKGSWWDTNPHRPQPPPGNPNEP